MRNLHKLIAVGLVLVLVAQPALATSPPLDNSTDSQDEHEKAEIKPDCGGPYWAEGWFHHGTARLKITKQVSPFVEEKPVPNAMIYADGKKVGVTDKNGHVYFNPLRLDDFRFELIIVKGDNARSIDMVWEMWTIHPVEQCEEPKPPIPRPPHDLDWFTDGHDTLA